MATQSVQVVNIRPGVPMLSVLRHLNYKPWFAVAEFVDNSIQSYLANKTELAGADGDDFKLIIEIEINQAASGMVVVRDNAAGIHAHDYERAFKPAELPADRSGLSEFGMGMKSAACWFSRRWSVRTSALGEPVERLIKFDVEEIVRTSTENLPIEVRNVPSNRHFTEVRLTDLYNVPQGKTVTKIKDHLASIYRMFLRNDDVEIRYNGESLSYQSPAILCAPYYKDLESDPILWRKDISLDFGVGLHVTGFAALRKVASTSSAGFALFRRQRLIQGSADEGYRPEYIFRKSNSYTYQRLFGEVHVEGFEVSHTKDGFRWEDNEEIFLEFLKDELESPDLPMLTQAEGHRVRQRRGDLKDTAEQVLTSTGDVIQRDVPEVFERELATPPEEVPVPEALPEADPVSDREIEVELNGATWLIVLELSADPGISEWVSLSDQPSTIVRDGTNIRKIGIRVSLAHPFMERFAGADRERVEPLVRVAAALMLAEVSARDGGVKMSGAIRKNVNELLWSSFSRP